MELQFQISKHRCLKPIKAQPQGQEQTQELRLPDAMPDIGRVLAAWGQTVLRGKQWQADEAQLNCGVMAWVLYAPEDGSAPRCVECWIPMTIRWEHPEGAGDGSLLLTNLLHCVDARAVSGRKMIVRATVNALAQMYMPYEVTTYAPESVPEDVCLLQRTYPVCLARECGEKAFTMDEELTFPATAPTPKKIIRYTLSPAVEDQKVLGDKAVFRGNVQLHVLYRCADGTLAGWDFSVPFSQYAELTDAYGHEAQIRVVPAVTAVELEMGEQGRLRLKAGLSGQYVLYDTLLVETVEDGYSPERTVDMCRESVELPSVLERKSQKLSVEQTLPCGSSRSVDVAFYPTAVHCVRSGEKLETELTGQFQMLYYDTQGALQANSSRWQEQLNTDLAENARMDISCEPVGDPQAIPGEASTALQGELLINAQTYGQDVLSTVSGLTVGEEKQKAPDRPSLILRRAGEQMLWDIAKAAGSTVEAIREANGLQGEPEENQILLIPVL